jgi:hypothetical protein
MLEAKLIQAECIHEQNEKKSRHVIQTLLIAIGQIAPLGCWTRTALAFSLPQEIAVEIPFKETNTGAALSRSKAQTVSFSFAVSRLKVNRNGKYIFSNCLNSL